MTFLCIILGFLKPSLVFFIFNSMFLTINDRKLITTRSMNNVILIILPFHIDICTSRSAFARHISLMTSLFSNIILQTSQIFVRFNNSKYY